jgi:hypothetical protein
MNGRPLRALRILFLLLAACITYAQGRGSATSKTASQGGRAIYVERFPKGYALIRYSGMFAREFSTPGRETEDVVVLFDGASRPVYALRPTTGETIELYKVVRKSNRDLIYAIPMGPYETRVYQGPFRPEDGFPKRLTNIRAVPDIDEAYLKPSARQKAAWMEEAPHLAALKLQR